MSVPALTEIAVHLRPQDNIAVASRSQRRVIIAAEENTP
jgi:hypothetical protein